VSRVARSGPGKTAKNKKEKRKKKYSGQQQKEIDYDEPHLAPNEKTQPIQWTEQPTGALVAVNSLWPLRGCLFQECPLSSGVTLDIYSQNPRKKHLIFLPELLQSL